MERRRRPRPGSSVEKAEVELIAVVRHLFTMAYKIGGPDQVRTDDLLNAIEALLQLSYEPIRVCEG